MGPVHRLALIISIVLVSATSVAAKDWRGILPMHSTRADVEALLGPPPPSENPDYKSNKNWAVYLVDDLRISIFFTSEDSLARGNCQLTAPGTVSVIRVSLMSDMSFSALNLDEKSFRKFDASDEPGSGDEGFIDEKEGLVIGATKGQVQEMVYVASAQDRPRCASLYDNLEELVRTRRPACGLRFDEYGDVRFADEKARLDNFAIQLLNVENYTGYIIVYAGRKPTVAEAQLRANRARDYLINVREIDPEKLKAIDGGYREELTVVLQILPPGMTPHISPTVPASEVEIIYPNNKPRSRKLN